MRAHPVEPAAFLDFVDRDPFAFYEELRSRGPVGWDESLHGWLVTAYEECAHVMAHEEVFLHPYGGDDGSSALKGERSVIRLRGKEHHVLHRYMTSYFNQRSSEITATIVIPLADRLIDRFAGLGRAELAADYTDKLVLQTVMCVLGLPIEDEDLLERCSDLNVTFTRWIETFGIAPDAEVTREAMRAAAEFDEILRPVIEARRGHPADDMVSDMWRKAPDLLDGWNADDILAQCKTLIPAGAYTTAHFLCSLAYLLLTDPSLPRPPQAPRDSFERAVEEAFRVMGPVHFRFRIAAEDVELAGVAIRAGDHVYPVNAAANRDPARFSAPDAIDTGRPGLRRHLAFNTGPRICAGAPLARSEAVSAMDRLLSRLPDIALDPNGPTPSMVGLLARSMRPLAVRFSPR